MRLVPSQIIERTKNRFNQFFKATAKSSIILLITTIIALFWANSSLAHTYFDLWKTHQYNNPRTIHTKQIINSLDKRRTHDDILPRNRT
jgi:Na+/H+ antiporter NhaA